MDYGLTEDRLEEFFWWMNERQEIFRRRFVEGEDEPWTDDPYLQDRHFCNVYRELDRVSRWYINEYVDEGLHPDTVFLTTFITRIFNKTETMEIIGAVDPHDWSPDELSDRLDQEDGLFNSAYMITGAIGESGEPKHQSYIRELFYEGISENLGTVWKGHFDDNWDPVTDPETLTDTWTTLPGVSDFIAYEVYCDLTYHDWFPYTENDYVNTGPGANRGINWIRREDEEIRDKDELKRSIEKTHVDTVDVIHWLRDNQDEYLNDEFYYWNDKRLTLRAIEHSLCEYDKWRRLKFNDEHDESQRMKRHTAHSEPLGIENEAEQMSDTGLGQF